MFGIKKIKPERNAVVITYGDDGKPRVTVECKDYDYEYPLVIAARHYLYHAISLKPLKERK